MSSFYGGQRGISFDLTRTYPSKESMILDFSSPDCTVAFGQYVSIDSSDADRGSIFKRTLDFSNGENGAVLVGKITGKEGINAKIKVVPYSSIADVIDYIPIENPTGNPSENGWYEKSGDDYVQTQDTTIEEKVYYEQIISNQDEIFINVDTISGKDISDSISFKTETVYEAESNTYETKYGIQLPYNVIEFESGTTQEKTVEIVPQVSEPFYQKYLLKFPPCLDGDSVKAMAFATEKNKSSFGDIYYSPENKTVIPAAEFRDMLVYKIYDTSTETSSWYKLCDFTQANLSYDKEKNCFIFLDSKLNVVEVPIKNLENVSLSETGILTLYYQDGSANPTWELVDNETIKNQNPSSLGLWEQYEEDGQIKYRKTEDTTVQSDKNYYRRKYVTVQVLNQNNPLKWIKSISLGDDKNSFVVTYNTNEQQVFLSPINSLKELEYTDTGEFLATYTQPLVIHNFHRIEEITTPINPVEENWYEISFKYYSTIASQIENEEITNEEEYLAAIETLVNSLGYVEDFYSLTEDESVVEYTYGESPQATWYKAYYIKDADTYSPNVQEVGTLRGIKSINYNEEAHKLVITYNTIVNGVNEKEEFDTHLKGVDSIEYDGDISSLVIKYSDSTEQELALALKVTGIRFNDEHQLVFTFNDQSEITTSQSISYPEKIQFNEETQALEMVMNTQYGFEAVEMPQDPSEINPKELGYYVFNTDTMEYVLTNDTEVQPDTTYYERKLKDKEIETISPALNFIKDVRIREDYHLLILFSDPEKQGNITYDDIEGWRDFGDIKDDSGLFIDLYIDPDTPFEITNTTPGYETLEDTIRTLNTNYPNGYKNNIHSCIAIGSQWMPKSVYAYDADHLTWYLLGTYASQQFIVADILDNEAKVREVLPKGGLWFVIEDRMDDYEEGIEYFGTSWEDF